MKLKLFKILFVLALCMPFLANADSANYGSENIARQSSSNISSLMGEKNMCTTVFWGGHRVLVCW